MSAVEVDLAACGDPFCPPSLDDFERFVKEKGLAFKPKLEEVADFECAKSRFVELFVPDVGMLSDLHQILAPDRLATVFCLLGDVQMCWASKVLLRRSIKSVVDIAPMALNLFDDVQLFDLACATMAPQIIIVEQSMMSKASKVLEMYLQDGPVVCMLSFDYTPQSLPAFMVNTPITQRIVLPPCYQSGILVTPMVDKTLIDGILGFCQRHLTNFVYVTEKAKVNEVMNTYKKLGVPVSAPSDVNRVTGTMIVSPNLTVSPNGPNVFYLDKSVRWSMQTHALAMRSIVILSSDEEYKQCLHDIHENAQLVGLGQKFDIDGDHEADPNRVNGLVAEVNGVPIVLDWADRKPIDTDLADKTSINCDQPMFGSFVRMKISPRSKMPGHNLVHLKDKHGSYDLLVPTLGTPNTHVYPTGDPVIGTAVQVAGSRPIAAKTLDRYSLAKFGATFQDIVKIGNHFRCLVTFLNGLFHSSEGYSTINPLLLLIAAHQTFPREYIDHLLGVQVLKFKDHLLDLLMQMATPRAFVGMKSIIETASKDESSASELLVFSGEQGKKNLRQFANKLLELVLKVNYSLDVPNPSNHLIAVVDQLWRHRSQTPLGMCVQDSVADLILNQLSTGQVDKDILVYNLMVGVKSSKHRWSDEFALKCTALPNTELVNVEVRNVLTDVTFSMLSKREYVPDLLLFMTLGINSTRQVKRARI